MYTSNWVVPGTIPPIHQITNTTTTTKEGIRMPRTIKKPAVRIVIERDASSADVTVNRMDVMQVLAKSASGQLLISAISQLNAKSSIATQEIESVCLEIDNFVNSRVNQNGNSNIALSAWIELIGVCLESKYLAVSAKAGNVVNAFFTTSTANDNIELLNKLLSQFQSPLHNGVMLSNFMKELIISAGDSTEVERLIWKKFFETPKDYYLEILEASDLQKYFRNCSEVEKIDWLDEVMQLFQNVELLNEKKFAMDQGRFENFMRNCFSSFLNATKAENKSQLMAINRWVTFLLDNIDQSENRRWILGLTLEIVEFDANWNYIIEAVVADDNLSKLIQLALKNTNTNNNYYSSATEERFRLILNSFIFEQLCPYNPQSFQSMLPKMIDAYKSTNNESLWYAIKSMYPIFPDEIENEFQFFFDSTNSSSLSPSLNQKNLEILLMFANRNPKLFQLKHVDQLHLLLGKTTTYAELIVILHILKKISFENPQYFKDFYCKEYYAVLKAQSQSNEVDFLTVNSILKNIAVVNESEAEAIVKIMAKQMSEEDQTYFTENVLDCWKSIAFNYPNIVNKKRALLEKLNDQQPPSIFKKNVKELLDVLPPVQLTTNSNSITRSSFCNLL